MKHCPRCQKTYEDPALNFCLDDGELLMALAPGRYADDSPPTVILDQARVTNPASWPQQPSSQPPARYQNPQPAYQNPQFGQNYIAARDQTLPTISLILGICSFLLVCCYGGIWLGLPAAIVGFIGLRNADSDSSKSGGRGLAIGGMVLGTITFLGSLIIALFAVLSGAG
ncbi:MAG: DUF4190 domain-containing protein [Pyrinomonadaceae bacterium]